MRVAVTGATGFVGRNLVDRLLQDSHEVTIVANRRSGANLFSDRVKYARASVHNALDLQDAFCDSQAVFHLVGIIAETRKNTFKTTVEQGTKNVISACRQNNIETIIYLSALGTSEDAESKYFKTKWAAEQSVKNSGLNWTIFRPSIIYGRSDGFLTMMSKIIKLSPFVPIFGDGKYRLQPVYIGDLVEAMAKSLTNKECQGETIEIGGAEPLEYVEIINSIKKALKKKRMNLFIPMAVIKPVAVLLEKILKPAPLTTDQLIMLEKGSVCDLSKMKRLFEIEPVGFDEGLKKVLEN